MEGNGETKMEFGAEAAGRLVGQLRRGFRTGRTRSYQWRVDQLRSLVKMMDEKEADIVGALRADLNKPDLESLLHETLGVYLVAMDVFLFYGDINHEERNALTS